MISRQVMNAERFALPSCRYFERKDLGKWYGGCFFPEPVVYCSRHEDRCEGCPKYENRIEVF